MGCLLFFFDVILILNKNFLKMLFFFGLEFLLYVLCEVMNESEKWFVKKIWKYLVKDMFYNGIWVFERIFEFNFDLK